MGCPRWLVNILDALLSILVLAPLVVLYWRGTFMLLDHYILTGPDYPRRAYSLAISFGVAVAGQLLFIYTQDILRDYAHTTPSPITELMIKRVYCYVYGLIVVNHWRAVWDFLDDWTNEYEVCGGLFCFLGGVGILMVFRCFRNGIAPPVVAASDMDDYFFTIATRFRVPRTKPFLFFLDALFGILVLHSSCVCVVRGAWYIFNVLFEFPKNSNPAYTYFLSFGLGMILVFISLSLQRPCAFLSKKLDHKPGDPSSHRLPLLLGKIVFEDCYMFIASLAGINIWRGVWGLGDEYVFKNDPAYPEFAVYNKVLSAWTCHILGMGGLMIMFHGNSALVKGYQWDGEFDNGEGCILPHSSLTIFREHAGQTHRKQIIVKKEATLATPEEVEDLMNGQNVIQVDSSSGKRRVTYPIVDRLQDLSPWEEKLQRKLSSEHPL